MFIRYRQRIEQIVEADESLLVIPTNPRNDLHKQCKFGQPCEKYLPLKIEKSVLIQLV